MNLDLNPDLGEPYDSPAQATRVITEGWARHNLYCLDCDEDQLRIAQAGTKVFDFTCRNCHRTYQLKSQKHPFRRRVLDAAWKPMVSAIKTGTVPSFLFLHYDPIRWNVADLFGVPSQFMTLSAIEKRKPLPPTARRAGWVGCNILLQNLPPDARVQIIHQNLEVPRSKAREAWRRFGFLKGMDESSRGWAADVLACVRRLNEKTFTLGDMYRFEEELSGLHPNNRHIRAKIRQQIHVLRDQDVIRFLGGGNYSTVDD